MVDKLKDLLKQVDKDTRRCIVFLNNKMDDQFKRVMTLKTAPVSPPQPVEVTELREELLGKIDELKLYVKSRDKVNKEAIKKLSGTTKRLFSNIDTGEESLDISDKINSVDDFLGLGVDGMFDYIAANMKNVRAKGIECEIFIDFDDVSKNFIFYHKNFFETITHMQNNEYEWLEYIQDLDSYPSDGLDTADLPFFKLSVVIVTRHLKRNKISIDPVMHFCIIDVFRGSLIFYVSKVEGNESPSKEKRRIMERDRDNWLPLNALLYNFAHQAELLHKFENTDD